MLEVKNLAFGYNKKFKLFENLSFTVNPGEIVKISGSNGCGKTTLFNCINGFFNPDSGSILFNNVNISKLLVYKISRLGIKRYFGNREFYSMRVEDVLRLNYSKKETDNSKLNIDYDFLINNPYKL
jgi:branched-chain amino acid transport system ATP-binding protein